MTKGYKGEPKTDPTAVINFHPAQSICPICNIYTSFVWKFDGQLFYACSHLHALRALKLSEESYTLSLIGFNVMEARNNEAA